MGRTKHFFNNKDVDIRTKYAIYNAFVINTVLLGCESWNLSTKNKNALESFHHSAIRRILNISWDRVRNERIRNKQVRFWFCNIPKIESYINKRTATYVGKIARSNDEELPKKILGAWMPQSKKSGGQQLSCNNNFARAISAVTLNALPESQDLLFREWMPLALDENEWMNLINKYFESCKTINEDREDEDKEHEAGEKTVVSNSQSKNPETLTPPPTPVPPKINENSKPRHTQRDLYQHYHY